MNKELLAEIAHLYGTPAYVYDLDTVSRRYRLLEKHFAGMPVDIHYAVKANFHPAVLTHLRELGAGVDCVSVHEVERALEMGFEPSQILFTPACPSLDELAYGLAQGVKVHVGSLEYLEDVARAFPGRPVGLRINPGIEGGGNTKISTAHSRSKFGIPWAYRDRLFELLDRHRIPVEGLHVHIGSDVHSWHDLAKGVDFLTEIASRFSGLRYLDFGSGFKIPYRPGEPEMDVAAYAAYIRKKMQDFPSLRVKIEPGKFLVAPAGVFLMQVQVVKQTPGGLIAGVNTGFNHMLRPMYYGAYHHLENLSERGGQKKTYDIVGHLCEEDTFARHREMYEIQAGDILAMYHAGAYGYVMASHYNLHPLPKEIIIQGKKVWEG